MAHAVKLNVPASSLTKVKTLSADALAKEYLRITAAEEELEAERTALKEAVRAAMTDGILVTSLGNFKNQARKSYSWSLGSVKDIFPLAWKEYVKPDAALLRERMERKDEAGCMLESTADVKMVEALVFKATA